MKEEESDDPIRVVGKMILIMGQRNPWQSQDGFSYVVSRINVVGIGLQFSRDDVSKNELLMLLDGKRGVASCRPE